MMAEEIKIPEEYEIDDKLVKGWFEIAPDETIELTLPRVALDMLFVSIQNAHLAQVETHNLAVELAKNSGLAWEKPAKKSAAATIGGVNALRQMFAVIMGQAILRHQLKMLKGNTDDRA